MTNTQSDFWLPFWLDLHRLYHINTTKYPTFTTFSKALIKFASLGYQLTLIDGQYVKAWSEINQDPLQPLKQLPGRKPQWYQRYIDQNTVGDNRHLLKPIVIDKAILPSHKPPHISPEYYFRPKSEWIVYWHAPSSSALFGRTIEQKNDPFSKSISFIEHWIHNPPSTFSIYGSPKKYPSILSPCPGCNLHTPFHRDTRPNCVFIAPTLHLHSIKTQKKDRTFLDNLPRIPYKKCLFLSQPINTLKVLIYNIYTHSIGIPDTIPSSTPLPTIHPHNINTLPNNSPLITRLLLGCSSSIYKLISLSSRIYDRTQFTFYTDGSVFNLGTPQSLSGSRWVETTDPNNLLTFNSRLTQHISSTHAEVMAILTALIICPHSSLINVYTDSSSCIHTFNKILNPLIGTRKLQKIPNHLIWLGIKYIISFNHLNVILHKVKAHSNILYNDMADNLAKSGTQLPHTLYINFKNLPRQNATLTWLNLGPIERPTRKWAKDIISCR
ncbi:hypothetical protein C1645_837043 [Glomus cerebriforme]|uniref:RNase H type-1 domain-containing protein n=1 Tax=Glomus cerebriforme TaxID=658196 RepID=A0A397S9L8_9GLOM|nr:hypothetical protein C1645_837043 [Glomus cerebriforme]